ncbi:MAG TPA: hypothetical protein PK675_04390 [Clostridia bacterium]|nr:hypothetical protein [Clostridia bacterium]
MDYGKIAYLKTQDLARRLSSVTQNPKENVIHMRKENVSLFSAVPQSFVFYSETAQYITIEVEINAKSGVGLTCPIDYFFNGLKIGTQEAYFTFYAPSAIRYIFYLKTQAGENTVSVTATHTNTIVGTVTLTARGVDISVYNESPLLDYYALNKYYCIYKNGVFNLYVSYLTSAVKTFDITALNIDKIKFYEGDNTKMFYLSNGKLYLTNFDETSIPEGVLLAQDVTDFCYSYYYKILFTIKGGLVYKQTLNIASPVATDAVLMETPEMQRGYKIFLSYYGSRVHLVIDSSSGVLLYLFNGTMSYLSKVDIENPVDIRVNSTTVSVLSLENDNANETIFTLTDVLNPVTQTIYSNIDAICYLSDTNYFAMQGGKLITF